MDCDNNEKRARYSDDIDGIMSSIEDSIAMEAAYAIKQKADIEVQLYLGGDEFRLFVERLKRKERERVYQEVADETKQYRVKLLEEKKTNIINEINEKYCELMLPELPSEIAMKNKIIEDAKIKTDYESKLKHDKERLQELRRIKNIQEITQQNVAVPADIEAVPERAQETTTKISFGMNKRRML